MHLCCPKCVYTILSHYAIVYPLFPKLYQHNLERPTHVHVHVAVDQYYSLIPRLHTYISVIYNTGINRLVGIAS